MHISIYMYIKTLKYLYYKQVHNEYVAIYKHIIILLFYLQVANFPKRLGFDVNLFKANSLEKDSS